LVVLKDNLMKSILSGILFLVICFVLVTPGCAGQKELPFKKLSIRFEVNHTDGDGEVVLTVKAPEGLKWFKVFAPDGETIISIQSSDERKGIDPIGLAQFNIESGEPSIDGVKAAYPEGTYRVLGKTISGNNLSGEVVLSHKLLPPPVFTPHDKKGVEPNNTVVKWQSVEGSVSYEVEIENDDLNVNVTSRLPGNATRFNVPPGFLLPGTEYELGVTSVSKEGNLSVAESSFVTAN
jgi:hypothetical protein